MSVRPSGPAYSVGNNPDYSLDINSIVKDDYVVDELMNYLVLRILQNIEHVRLHSEQKANIVLGPTKPETGPALWLDTGKSYEDSAEGTTKTAVLNLGEPGGDADLYAEIEGNNYPVTNATGKPTDDGFEVVIDTN